MNNKYVTLITVLGIAVFFYSNIAVSRVEFPKPLFREQPESGFFIGEDMKLCECGCGQEIIFKPRHKYTGTPRFIMGHCFRDKHHTKEANELNRQAHLGKKHSEETKKKISKRNMGRIASEKAKETIKKQRTGKTWEEIYGIEKAKKTREKLSKSLTGRPAPKTAFKKGNITWNTGLHPECYQGKNNPFYGKQHTNETIQKISGENNVNWQGGISFEPYSLNWTNILRNQVRYRDNYKCQLCGVLGIKCKRKLCVHHIDYNKKNCKEDNLISLCSNCHSKTNNNRKYWIKYFNEM